MPYEGEFASHKPLTRIAGHPRVQAVLARCKRRDTSDTPFGPRITPASLGPSGWLPDWIIALDGSLHQAQVENGFPGAEVCYMTIAAVMLDVEKMRQLDKQRPVHPKDFRSTQYTGSLDCVLPGCNVVLDEEESALTSFRRAFYEESRAVTSTDGGETLLETYEALLAHKPPAPAGSRAAQACPYEDCDDGTGQSHVYEARPGCTACRCAKRRRWWSTDATRIYQAMNPLGPSGEMFGEVMAVWERVYVVNILRSMIAKGYASSFARVAVVLDGPLAVHGHPAWLSKAIMAELRTINATVRAATGKDLLLVGVEKSGAFVEHFELIDLDPKTGRPRFDPQSVFPLSNDYIRENIRPGIKPWGVDEYFGRKVFYKTKSGARVVATLPILTGAQEDRDDVSPSQYPRLADAMSLLDSVVSSRYPNSLSPLVAAHAEAAIPLNMGKKVLEQLAKELVGRR
jgi:hypothetical protein